MSGRMGESGKLAVAAALTLAVLTSGCAQNLRTEPRDSGVQSFPTTVRLTDNANAVYGDMTYYFEDNVVVSEIPATPNDAWAHLLTAYEAVGLEPSIQDVASLTVGVQEARVSRRLGDQRISTYLSCGRDMTGNLADRATIRVWMITRLRAVADDRTEVRTELTANATDNDGTSRSVRPCSSNHRLEAFIANHVADGISRDANPGA
jgi:hypothetical protein